LVQGGCFGVTAQAAQYKVQPIVGLGDMVAAGLGAVGITKDRVQAVAKSIGVEDCGCQARQDAMNRFGQKYLGIGQNPIDSP
jgi:hypothetical protein